MFAGLKNKIKEETGGDVGKIAELVTTTLVKSSRHSRQGSTTSLGSFSIDGGKDDSGPILPLPDIKLSDGRALTAKEFKKLESKEDEWRKKLQKKDDDWRKKLEEKDRELQKVVEKKDLENSALLSEIRELQLTVKKLEDEVQLNSEYKAKLCQYQEDIDQLEGFQSQEMAKIKHLLLQKEQLLAEKEIAVGQQGQKISDLAAEIRRLHEAERSLADAQDRLETLRHESETDKVSLTSKLAAEEESSRHLKDRLAVLEERYKAGCVGLGGELTIDERVQGLLGERALYERLLAEAHEHLSEVKTSWSGKITSLETQVERLCRQASEESDERRSAERQRDELVGKLLQSDTEIDRLSFLNQQLKTQVDNLINSLNGQECVGSVSVREDEIATLKTQCSSLTDELFTEKEKTSSLSIKLEQTQKMCHADKREKDELLMRNAQVSQEVELIRQELRTVKKDSDDMQARMGKLQAAVREQDEMLGRERIEKDILARRVEDLQAVEQQQTTADGDVSEIRRRNSELEGQLLDKNKALKNLQQRLSDMKKTMAKELKVSPRSIDPGDGGVNGSPGEGYIQPHGPALLTPMPHPPSPTPEPQDINFKYLKHVLFKFLTCREYEAQHLTRAVATLLRFTAEEERLLRETLDWRSSWFGSRPRISGGLS